MTYLLMLLGIAALSIEISDSTLSNRIKKFLYLDKDNPTIKALSSFKFYNKLLPFYYFTLLIIPILLIIFMFKIYRFIQEILSCPFCISFYLGITHSYLIMNGDILTSIIYGGVTLLITKAIDRYLNEW